MKSVEIVNLNAWRINNNCEVKRIGEFRDTIIQVDFLFNSSYYKLYIEDEYNDFNEKNQLLCIYLVLRSLKDYQEEDDFLKWCNLYYLNASDSSWLDYYRSLGKIIPTIESASGKIETFISDLDYQLRSGPFYELVNFQQ